MFKLFLVRSLRFMKHFIVGFLLLFSLQSAFALVKVTGLDTGVVPVASRAQADWTSAVQQAWLQVLTKVSGNSDIGTLPVIQDSIKTARTNVLSYHYISREIAGQKQPYLRVRFDNTAITTALRKSNQPLWNAARPQTLIWLAVQTPQGDTLLASDSDDLISKALKQDAFDRGLPIVLPIMDLRDLNAITADDVMRLDPVVIDAASKRYIADDVLAGKLYMNMRGQWQGRFMFITSGQFVNWQTQGKTPEAALHLAMNDLTNALASRYAALEGQGLQMKLILHVNNVTGLNDYADVVKYLRSLEAVTKVNVSEVDGQTLALDVTVMGGAEALNKALKNSQKLFVEPNQNNDGSLYFSWGQGLSQSPAVTHDEAYSKWQHNSSYPLD